MSDGIKSAYAKNLTKKLQKTTSNNFFQVIKNEMLFLFNQVDNLLAIAKNENKTKAKSLIGAQIKQLPQKDMFRVIRELAIKYNPVLSNLIISRSDFSLQQVFG